MMGKSHVQRFERDHDRLLTGRMEAEERDLAQREQGGLDADCECQDGMFPRGRPGRRRFLFGAGTAASSALIAQHAVAAEGNRAPPGAVLYDVATDPTREQGRPVAEDGGYGSRSQ